MLRRALSPLLYFTFTIALLAMYFPVAKLGCAARLPWQTDCSKYTVPMFSEDGLGEWLQFVVLLLMVGVSVWQARHSTIKYFWYLVGLAAFFVAAEEISWGQRIFDLEWAALQEHNHQNETNLHNLLPLYGNTHPYWIVAVLGVIGGLFAAFQNRILGESTRMKGLTLAATSAIMAALYAGLEPEANAYFYEYSELWIYATGLWLCAHFRLYSRLP